MKREELLEKIAQEHLSIETLKERGLDRLDFYDVNVLRLKDALEAAYEAGKKDTPKRAWNADQISMPENEQGIPEGRYDRKGIVKLLREYKGNPDAILLIAYMME